MKRYYQIKSEGKFFAKCPKTDSDPNVKDGREYRSWEYAGKEGQTLGWFKDSVKGRITGAEVKPLGEDMFFCIYIDNGDVVQFKLYESNFLSLAQILGSIELSEEVEFKPALNQKKSWTNKYGKLVVPTALYVNQGEERLAQRWPYNEADRWFDGLPKPVVEEKFGRKTRDSSNMEAAFDGELDSFIQRVDAYLGIDNEGDVESTDVEVEDLAF
jgi:hypothetical protein